MNEHLPKPIDPSQLYTILSQYLITATTNKAQSEDHEPSTVVNILPESLPGIDFQWGLERIGGNIELYHNLLKEFSAKHRRDLTLLETHLKAGNITDTIRILHTLEGVSGNIGAHGLQKASKELQQTLMKRKTNNNLQLSDNFRHAFTDLLTTLDYYLAKPVSTVTTTSPPVQKTISEKERDRLIKALDEMLAAGNPDAKEHFQTFEQTLNEPDDTELKNLLAEQIQEYDFDLARETLATLSEQLRNR
jgi:polar amino acid transport system substrate-binding protein